MKRCPKCELNWIQDNEDICVCCEPQLSTKHEKAINFYKLGLKVGDIIEFTNLFLSAGFLSANPLSSLLN